MNIICSLEISDGTQLQDICIDQPLLGHVSTTLRFLSIVETNRIPLHLILGSPCNVVTSSAATAAWFGSHLSKHLDDYRDDFWWLSQCADSPLGILAAVDLPQQHNDGEENVHTKRPRVTEILFYVTKESVAMQRTQASPLTSPSSKSLGYEGTKLSVQAISLSSDLLKCGQLSTPPLSPVGKENVPRELESIFLPQPTYTNTSFDSLVIHSPPTRKKRTVNDAFDAADERRRVARHRGGESIIAAAGTTATIRSTNAAVAIPSLRHQRSTSNSVNCPVSAAPKLRTFSRSASVASSCRLGHPAITQAASSVTHERRSSLSRFESPTPHLPALLPPPSNVPITLGQKNKETISRVVMAGMRLHGLSQQRPSKSRSDSISAHPAQASVDIAIDVGKDEEYKLVYHQVYKAACFAFRRSIGSESLAQRPETTGEVVEGLLALFLRDPLASDKGRRSEVAAGAIVGEGWG
ncbi:hypothetical protein K431DRAFT_59695 [Polychaeton citri CBS 116435]|uniref:Sld7 C-terminal domain-containing protein n=1 Tax=Polychaeton citri CBS 116435 TaxID=1314669 RepID=A0A9P4QC36_9PEZI|nr:hypothetical protein K431DRAFT_59695 [Polychaeton citri CBS 116435]